MSHSKYFFDYVCLVMSVLLPKVWFNSGFAKAGVSRFYDSEVLNSSYVHLMKFSAEKPRLRQAANRNGKTTENTRFDVNIL